MPTKSEVLGNQILKRIHTQDTDQGGVFTETTGAMGSGKTSVLLGFAEYDLRHHRQDKVFWSEVYDSPLQIFKIEDENIHLMVLKDSNVIFRDRDKNLKKVALKPTYFEDFYDCYKKAMHNKINVVFFGDRTLWRDFIKHLRGLGRWVHIFIDEFAEICPAYSSEEWIEIGKFCGVLKDVRRCMMNLHINTQAISNIDFRARNQIMIKIFLPGAMADKRCRVTQRAIDNLEKNRVKGNRAYVVNGGEFGVVRFKKIYKPRWGRHYEAHVIERGEGTT